MATALNYPQYIFYLQKPVSIVRQPSDIARQEAKYGEKIAYLTFEFGNIIPICEAQTELCERMNRHRELGKKEAFYSDQLVYTADSPITQSLSTLLNTHGVYADHQTLSQYVTETSLDKIRVYQLKK